MVMRRPLADTIASGLHQLSPSPSALHRLQAVRPTAYAARLNSGTPLRITSRPPPSSKPQAQL
jgi:hypothetical protein